MIEIIGIIWLMRGIGSIVREKGGNVGLFKFLVAVFWFLGEGIGFLIFRGIASGSKSDTICYLAPVCIYGGAAVGAIIIYFIAKNLESNIN